MNTQLVSKLTGHKFRKCREDQQGVRLLDQSCLNVSGYSKNGFDAFIQDGKE